MEGLKSEINTLEQYIEPSGFDDFDYETEHSMNDWVSESESYTSNEKHKLSIKVPYDKQPIIAFDTEYTVTKDGKSNIVLSCQLVLRYEGKSTKQILYTKSASKSNRLVFDKCIVQIIKKALDEKVLTNWPLQIIVCAHFLKADLFNFNKAFDNFQTYIKGVRKTVATLGKDAYGIDLSTVLAKRIDKQPFALYDESRNKHEVKIRFYDTMLLSPNGKSLADVGELVGLPKLDIPLPYSIERMNEYLREDPTGFEAYAMRDAEITALHMERMVNFAKSIGLKSLPYTIGGISVKAFIDTVDGKAYRQLFGFTPVTKEIWPEGRSKPLTITKDVPRPDRMILESFATQCYHGGRNESYMAGPTNEDTWNDFDAPSCYTTILMGLRELDYLNAKQSKNLEDFFGDICSFAWVEFNFPANTVFPSLPVRTDSYGLVYPLQGESFCTGHELEVAFNQGADITVKIGYIVPWKNNNRIFEPFMSWVRQERLKHQKGSFEERLIKEIGNSCYGKLAQGLKPKTAFDIEVGYSKQMPASTLTNPYFAAYTTGLARALMSEMLNGIPLHKEVVSVTTDGFLTNANIDEIELSGAICQRFRTLFHLMDANGGEILELKHRAKQLIAMKTRGQLTLKPYEGFPIITAKAGVKTPKGVNANDYMVDIYLNRVVGQLTDGSYLTSNREMFLGKKDMVNEQQEIRLNLEFDFKRAPHSPLMIEANGLTHISLKTKPHMCVEDMVATRLRFDRWRKNNCLKTIEDYHHWEDRLAMGLAILPTNLRLKPNETSDELLLRLFLRFCTQSKCMDSTCKMNANELAKYLEGLGYQIKATFIRNCKRQKLVYNSVPVTRLTAELLKKLLKRFPNFQYQDLFIKQQLELLESMLNS